MSENAQLNIRPQLLTCHLLPGLQKSQEVYVYINQPVRANGVVPFKWSTNASMAAANTTSAFRARTKLSQQLAARARHGEVLSVTAIVARCKNLNKKELSLIGK